MLDLLITCDPAERPTVADAMGHNSLSMEQKGPKPSEDTPEQSLSSEFEEISESVESLGSQEGLKKQDSPLSPMQCWGKSQLKAYRRQRKGNLHRDPRFFPRS